MQTNDIQKVALINSTKEHIQKKTMLREIDRARFSRLLRHQARKRSGSIHLQPWNLHEAAEPQITNDTLLFFLQSH